MHYIICSKRFFEKFNLGHRANTHGQVPQVPSPSFAAARNQGHLPRHALAQRCQIHHLWHAPAIQPM